MLHKLVAILRRMLVGPSLDRLSGLEPRELHNLLMTAAEPPLAGMLGAPTSTMTHDDGLVSMLAQTVEALRRDNAALAERIEVLERLQGLNGRQGPEASPL